MCLDPKGLESLEDTSFDGVQISYKGSLYIHVYYRHPPQLRYKNKESIERLSLIVEKYFFYAQRWREVSNKPNGELLSEPSLVQKVKDALAANSYLKIDSFVQYNVKAHHYLENEEAKNLRMICQSVYLFFLARRLITLLN